MSSARLGVFARNIQTKYPVLFAITQQQPNLLKNITENDLNALENILNEYPIIAEWFQKNEKTHHPTLKELLILQEGNHLDKISFKLLFILNHAYISSEDFIDLMSKTDDEIFEAQQLLETEEIQFLLSDKKLALRQILNLTPNQFKNLDNYYIRQLLAPHFLQSRWKQQITSPYLTIKQALILSPQQRAILGNINTFLNIMNNETSVNEVLNKGDLPLEEPAEKEDPAEAETPPTENNDLDINNPLKEKLIKDLGEYIKKINDYNGNYKHGFIFFKNSRAASRESNFYLAQTLKLQLEFGENIDAVFSPENIQEQREKPEIDRGINGGLNRIIKEAIGRR